MSITLLHLSDLQFGRHHADDAGGRPPLYEEDKYDVESQKIISDFKILQKLGVKPSYLVLSGDISETSSPDEYVLAIDFINKIIEFYSIDKKNVILVPGNHDINRTLCQSARLRAKALNKEFNPPYFEKFEIYRNFFSEFYSDIEWKKNEDVYTFEKKQLFNTYVFHERKLSFIGLNSCIDESELPPHYGNITIEQCNKAFEELNATDPDKNYKRIVVMHHNFIGSSDNNEENLKDADELLPILIENKVNIIIHGHQHITKNQNIGINNTTIPVLATGSAGLDSNTLPENSRRYQFIELHKDKLRIYKRRFDYKQTHLDGKGCWVPDITPIDEKIYSEIDIAEKGKKNLKQYSSEKYDLYKIIISDNALRGKDILILAYPRREIVLIDRVLDHKSKIYYEYLSVRVELNSHLYFLFVGKNINQTATINHFLQNNELQSFGLTICTPRVMSKGDGGAEFRALNIENTAKQTIYKQKKIKSYALSVYFIDDYVWENCLDLSFRKQKFVVAELPYFIDQNIYMIEGGNETNLGLSLNFFDEMFDKQYEEKILPNPISIILASGGMGKSTLCDKIANKINRYDKKKAIYINAEDIKDKLEFINHEIKTITDLFCAYDTANGSKHTSLHDPNNLEINISCGNVIVIIDGLDEIESSLMDKFNISNFLDSIVGIDNYFNNCRLIITSRDYHKKNYINREGVSVFYLKGFDDRNVEQYFKKRFPNEENKVNKSLEYVKKLNIKIDNYYMPLFLQLIANFAIKAYPPLN